MKLPKRISDIIARKQSFIDSQRVKLENTVIRQQSELLSSVVTELIPNLDVKDGVIQETANNYRQLASLDRAYKSFSKLSNTIFLNQMTIATGKIASLNETYFKTVLSDNMPSFFDKVVSKTDKLTNLRLGLDGGKLVRGGFLESFFNSNTLGTELKQFTSKAVTSNMDLKDFTKGLKSMITGSPDYKGGLERQFARYAYDIYQQYDAAYNLTIGNELGFNYFIYQGGLIEDSRDFCREHNGFVYSKDDTKEWPNWTPAKAIHISEFKQKDLNAVPSYLNYPGYDPMIDRGGYNCRHALGWIPDELALKMKGNE